MEIIARIYNDFAEKFGVPRQSGIVTAVQSQIVFEPEYRNVDAVRGLEGFSHLWLLWSFSQNRHNEWSPTVRPPRLGGNERIGVFATRSPYRPNAIGLSCVKIESIDLRCPHAPIIIVSGADLVNNTPIFDIKPYVPYADCIPEATGGFTDSVPRKQLKVQFADGVAAAVPAEKMQSLIEVLATDPRPAYHNDANRIYGMSFANLNVSFRVNNATVEIIAVVNG